MNISIIVPIYNEESNLPVLYDKLLEVVKKMGVSYEFIFVDDGSKDNSFEVILQLAEKDRFVKYIKFSRNFGHQKAVCAGLFNSKGDAVVIIDADLQDPPETILNLYEKYKNGYEIVYAKRREREGETFFKKFTAKMFYRILRKITVIDIPLDTGDFRIIDRKVVEILKRMPESSKFIRGQIAWTGFKQTFVEYDRKKRNAGNTGYNYRKMFRFAIDGIISFSELPLKLSGILGFIVSSIAFFLMIYAFYSKFILQKTVPGWTSLMISVLFIGGIQLICIACISEYICRMHQDILCRPLYVVDTSNIEKVM